MLYRVMLHKSNSYIKDKFIVPAIGAYAPMKRVYLFMDSGEDNYSMFKDGNYRIVLGSQFFNDNVRDLYDNIRKNEARNILLDTFYYLLGLYYHEFAHVLYTSFDTEAFDCLDDKQKNQAHQLFNILEDPYIEMNMRVKIKRSRRAFDFLLDKLFRPQLSEYKDGEGYSNFYQYLLLALRLGVSEIKEVNSFFADHKEDILSYVKKFFSTTVAADRPVIAVEFYKYLLDNGLDFSADDYEDTMGESMPPESDKAPEPEEGKKIDGSIISRRLEGMTETPTESKKPDKESISDEDLTATDETTTDDYVAPTTDAFESYDELSSGVATHDFVVLKDVMDISPSNSDRMLEKYEDTIEKFSDIVEDCMSEIDEVITIKKARDISGYSSGKVSIGSFMKGDPVYKCFSRPSGPDVVPDLCFYLLVDGSGSMAGEKSYICTQAMMILYECLSKLELPFELSTFTNEGDYSETNCLTYIIKSFEDDSSFCKNMLCFTDSRYFRDYNLPDELDMFSGNYDEVNIGYCSERLLNRSNTQKVMIVLSDGYTCGSSDVLTERIKELESQGVLVLGIGICSESVEVSYKNNKVFSSSDDLKNLPEFLSEFLVSLY